VGDWTSHRDLLYIHVFTESGMTKATTRTFRSGNSEAVRLPRDLAFGGDVELTLVKSGDVLTIYPTRPPVADLVARLAALPRPAAVEIRDEEDLLERPGL
jgi:antitoxin VapB